MSEVSTQAPHPAKFSSPLLPVIAKYLRGYRWVLDPMAGVGTLARFIYSTTLDEHEVTSNELEGEWARQCPEPWYNTDARRLWFAPDGHFDAIATSPTYGNRMADHHEATERCRACHGTGDETFRFPDGGVYALADGNCPKCGGTGRRQHKRHTYRHTLGRALTPGNTGAMQWGQEYRDTHEAIIAECVRVLRPGGRVVWNVKDHIRKGEVIKVVEWHAYALERAGLVVYQGVPVPCLGQRHGQNGSARVDHEWVLVFDKPEARA